MKKTVRLVFIVSFIFAHINYAQDYLTEPINFFGRTAHSLFLPSELMLFVPDTATQIIFNPSRATEYTRQFVYLSNISTYRPYSNNNSLLDNRSSFSAISLFHDWGSKWLLSAEYGSQGRDFSSSSFSFNEYSTSQQERIENTDLTEFNLRMVNICNWLFSKSALGINVNYAHSPTENKYLTKSIRTEETQPYNLEEQNDIYDNYKYQIGLEFSTYSDFSNYIGSISYQKSTNEADNLYRQRLTDFADGGNYYEERISSSSQSPNTISTKHYFSFKPNYLFDDDNIFIAISGFYSLDKFESHGHGYYLDNNYFGDLPDSSFSNSAYQFSDINRGFLSTTGYVFQISSTNVKFVGGARLSLGLRSYTRNTNQESTSRSRWEKRLNSSILFPATIFYYPTEKVSIYGAIVYNYYYDHLKITESSLSDGSGQFEAVTKENSFHSSTTLYLGADVTLPMNFKVHAFFGDDLASYKNWSVSLGYYF